MRTLVLLSTLFCLAFGKPNGYYHQEYGYKASSASYRNNELQHSKDDEGYYSKDGDLEGRVRPRVNEHNQHSEYINPKMQHSYAVADRSSSFGQLHAGHAFNQDMEQAGAAYGYMGQHHAAVNTNLRQITMQLQEEMMRELQRSVYDHYQRASAYGQAISQAQVEADMRAIEEEIRRNVTVRMQEALKNHYGNQGVRGGYSYTILNGRLQPTANYHSQELAELTRQMEETLMRELATQIRTYYHTTVNTEVHTRRNTYRRVNGNYPPVPIQQPPPPQMYPPMRHPPPPMSQPHPQPVHIPVHVPDSITTIATRVQTELNEHLNKILEDIEKRYFSTSAYHNIDNYNFDQILAQLQEELRANITFHLDDEIKRTYGFSNYASKYSVEDVENLRRQIEYNLMTKLNRDFNKQREKFFQTHMPNRPMFQPRPIPANHIYYPVNNFHQQGDITAIQRQLQETMSRQLQMALMQQSYRQAHMYGSNFNADAHYQATLQQLSEELNRNLTRHMEHLYNQQQFQHSGTYQAQLANMRNQLQMELQRQLQHGLQQSYSRHSTWSSSASRTSSTNYRPVRGFDPNLYRSYGPPGNVAIVGEDCMMGDDPAASEKRKKRSLQTRDDEGLTQQIETSDEDFADLTQQSQALNNQNLLRQVETFTDQQGQTNQDLTQQIQTHDDLTQQIQTHDDLTQQAQTLDRQDLAQQVQTHDALTQQKVDDHDDIQQVQTSDSLREPERIQPVQTQRRWDQSQDLIQQQPTQQIQTDSILNQAHGLVQSTTDLDLNRPAVPATDRYNYYTPIYRRRFNRPRYSYDSFSGHPTPYTVGQRVQYYESLSNPQQQSPYYPWRSYNNPPIEQQTQETDLTQQAQTLYGPQSNNQFTTPTLNNQYPSSSIQDPTHQNQPLGEQIVDPDLTQQTQTIPEPQSNSQYRQYTPPNINNQYRPLGQQVDDTDLTQQTLNEPQLNTQHSSTQRPTQQIWTPRPFQRPNEQIRQPGDSYMTQHSRSIYDPQPSPQSTQAFPSSRQIYVPNPQRPLPSQSQQLSQQTENLSLTQQILDQPQVNNYERDAYRSIPSQSQQLGQQTEDIDLDKLEQKNDQSELTQQVQQPQLQRQETLRPSRIYDAPLSQQTQDNVFGQQSQLNQNPTQQYQPSQNYLGPPQPDRQSYYQNYRLQRPWDQQRRQFQPHSDYSTFSQQRNEDLTHPGREPSSYTPLRPWDQRTRPSQSQQDVFGQTQQTEDDDFGKLSQVDVLGQTQQTEDDDFGKLSQQPQQVNNVGLTQQTEDDTFGKLSQQSRKLDTADLTQQTEDEDFRGLARQDLTQQETREPLSPPQSQQFDDITGTQQREDDLFAKFSQQQQRQPSTRPQYQQVEDLTQQQEDDFLDQQQRQTQTQSETREPLAQQVEDLNLTQQTEDDDFARLSQQSLTQQTEDLVQPNEPQTSTDKTQTSQQLTQQVENVDIPSQHLSQQTQDLIRDEINQRENQFGEDETNTDAALYQQQDIDQENQQLIDLLKNQAEYNRQNQQNENIGPMSYSPKPVYADVDGHPIQVGITRQGPPRPPHYYYNPETAAVGIGAPSNVNYAQIQQEEITPETVKDIEPVEPQVADEVQQVEVKGSPKTEEPVAPVEPEVEIITSTTAKPGFWSRLGTNIRNKIG